MAKDFYKLTVRNKFLDKKKILTASSKELLNEKVKKQKEIWIKKEDSLKESLLINEKILQHNEKTKLALYELDKYKNILNSSLNYNYRFNFDTAMRNFNYPSFKFVVPKKLSDNKVKAESKVAELSSSSLLNKILKKVIISKNSELSKANKELNLINEKISKERVKQLNEYKKEKEIAKNKIIKENIKLTNLKLGYESFNNTAIKSYFTKVLNNSVYDFKYKKRISLSYDELDKELTVSLQLPNKNDIPSVIEYKYIKSTDKTIKKTMTTKSFEEFYSNIIYQIILKTINELFNSDYNNTLESIRLNGFLYVTDEINKTSKIPTRTTNTVQFNDLENLDKPNYNKLKPHFRQSIVVSVSASKDVFNRLNLKKSPYKESILKLNGIISKNILKATEIKISNNLKVTKPKVQNNKDNNTTSKITSKAKKNNNAISNRNAKRSNKTKITLHKSTNAPKNLPISSTKKKDKINLATMHWECFEDLIGELFSKEFSRKGSIVEVTKRSRDGGADVIAIDPDPIRGGKYIIQVKRYNKTVSPTAIRDLYGTVQHEGAVKGILITTSNFGNDSFNFIKNKPLTLINGDSLLKLLKKHGYNNFEIILTKK